MNSAARSLFNIENASSRELRRELKKILNGKKTKLVKASSVNRHLSVAEKRREESLLH